MGGFVLNYEVKVDPSEAKIETKVCDYGKTLGIENRKYVNPARRSAPDRIFFAKRRPHPFVFFIEFKRRGKKPTPAQLAEHEFYRRLGFFVFVVDNVDDGKLVMEIMA